MLNWLNFSLEVLNLQFLICGFLLYDKSVLKAMIFATASRKKVCELGIKPENAVHFLSKVVTASTEY